MRGMGGDWDKKGGGEKIWGLITYEYVTAVSLAVRSASPTKLIIIWITLASGLHVDALQEHRVNDLCCWRQISEDRQPSGARTWEHLP